MNVLDPTPVVSVRLNKPLVVQLDALVKRTGRSRGFYLRRAVELMLPVLEAQYWGHQTQTRIDQENAVFADLMRQLNDPQTDLDS